MRSGSVLIESVFILAIAVFLGTAVHKWRPDKEKRIAFVAQYPNWWKVKPAEVKAEKPAEKPAPVPQTPVGTKPVDVSPGAVEQPLSPVPRPVPPAAPLKGPGREVSVDEALNEFKSGNAIFIDARRTRFFAESRIPNARSLSPWEADKDQKVDGLLKEVPSEMPIVIYCTGGDCEDSHMVAQLLSSAGYLDLRILRGGFPEWQKQNLPVEKPAGGAPPAGVGDEEGEK